ncbi:hypothetical protein AB0M28_38820 [Streptomyces sp. NPDC051940]|uniref:hypothetical protein n=1 Tax=Streptomyces sp. NPDC051940 TaxID=3155675 RepID=UPI00341D55BD
MRPVGPEGASLDYICYISRSKVDGLHAQLHPEQDGEITEQVVTERSNSGDLQAGLSLGQIVSLFKGGITYGRRNVIQRERKIKTAYTEKLREVLLAIAADHGNVPDIRDTLPAHGFDSVYYFYEGAFRVQSPVSSPTVADVVTLRSTTGDRTVHFDCSLRYFSEGPEADGQFLLHSGNHRFFTGGLSLTLSGVFVLLGAEGDDIFGTPLYLQLSASGMVAL